MNDNDIRWAIAKAKGWKVWEMNPGQKYDGMQYVLPPDEYPDAAGYGYKFHQIDIPTKPNAFDDDAALWPFEIAAAWPLVEEMADNGYCPALIFDDNGHWALTTDGVQTCPSGDEPEDISTTFFVTRDQWQDTATRAICMAWLKWKGVEVE